MNKVDSVVRVGISDLNFAQAPQTIRTSGLGSCIGVIIYDSQRKVAGLAHIMLPDSSLTRQIQFNPFKYADTAIPILIEHLIERGARKFALQAKIAGGAQMFKFKSSSEMMRIGARNVTAIKKLLSENNIPIIASDVGGSNGRTIEFDPSTSELMIRTVNKGEKII